MRTRRTRFASRVATAGWLLSILYSTGAVWCQWHAGEVRDPETFETVPAAVAEDAVGNVFAVVRSLEPARLIGLFQLSPRDRDFLDESGALSISVDDQPAFRPSRIAGGLKSVSFLLWNQPGAPTQGLLRALLDGAEMLLTYPLAGGGYKESRFSLQQMGPTIEQTLGVRLQIDPADVELAALRDRTAESCLSMAKPKARDQCFKQLGQCLDLEPGSAEALARCLSPTP